MSELLTADTSVVVAALSEWHEAHVEAWKVCQYITALPGHVLLETISVLTRLPQGLAVSAQDAHEALCTNFPDSPFALPPEKYQHLVEIIGKTGLRGGQVYDAQVAACAVHANAQLLTRDRRAEITYQSVGVSYTFIGKE